VSPCERAGIFVVTAIPEQVKPSKGSHCILGQGAVNGHGAEPFIASRR
jgi:hypothetical protein